MRLDIDVGNTRLKWRLLEGDDASVSDKSVMARGVLSHADFSERSQLFDALAIQLRSFSLGVDAIRVGSVAGDEFDRDFSNWSAATLSVLPQFAVVTEFAAGVRVGYEDPHLLGVDRWLAILAASRVAGVSRVIVADCGSAITVDVLEEGCHLGGYIAPGVRLMRESLLGKTSRIGSAGAVGDELFPGSSTSEAVANGVVLMAAAFVEQASQRFVERGGQWRLLLTGGDAGLLKSHLNVGVETMLLDELVLDGLAMVELKLLEQEA